MASILPPAKTQFSDANGVPLGAGSVYFYTPGTTTPKDTYQDPAASITNTNPVLLDSAGEAVIYGVGAYRQIVKDSLGNTIWDQVTSDTANITGALTVSGSANIGGNLNVAGTFPGQSFLGPWAGAVTRTSTSKGADICSLLDFGASASAADNTVAVNNWVAAVMTTGGLGYMPPGNFVCMSNIIVDWRAAARTGAVFVGAGNNRSVLDLRGAPSAPSLLMTCTATDRAEFYGVWRDIGILGNCAGPVLQIGTADHADAFNGFDLKTNVANSNTTTSAVGIAINGMFNCDVNVVANCAGHGTAFVSTYMCFCRLFGSFSGADTGLWLTNFYTFGNVFTALDLEVVNTCVQIDSANATRNTWIGGTYVNTNGSGPPIAAINATTGGLNRFIGGNFGSAGTSPICASGGNIGVIIYGEGIGTESFGAVLAQALSSDGDMILNSAAGFSAFVTYSLAGVTRWEVGRNNATEATGDVGSDYVIARFHNAGSVIDNPFVISRSTGQVTVLHGLSGQTGIGAFGATVPATQPVLSGSATTNTAALLYSLIQALGTAGAGFVNSTSVTT